MIKDILFGIGKKNRIIDENFIFPNEIRYHRLATKQQRVILCYVFCPL